MIAAIAFAATGNAANVTQASKIETYYLLVLNNAKPGQEQEFNKWYEEVHVPELLTIPGVVAAQRFVTADVQLGKRSPPQKYLALFTIKTDNLQAVYAEINRRVAAGETVIPTALDYATGQMYTFKALSVPVQKKNRRTPVDVRLKTDVSSS